MSNVEQFSKLVEKINLNCGVLEMLTNLQIHSLGQDSILSKELVTLEFVRRIKVLRQLLHERTKLPAKEIDSLCDYLSRIAADRNVVAHPPVATDDEHDTNLHIVGRQPSDFFTGKVFTEKHLNNLYERTREALKIFYALAINATKS